MTAVICVARLTPDPRIPRVERRGVQEEAKRQGVLKEVTVSGLSNMKPTLKVSLGNM